ncbi:uncharacterized protein K452DRAFT_78302 [Aplosporella prunicola CBS 121167]|uniref:Uncharacterized protein n=1 Tax=Aplosporella prunicola CBS 121167 TaxID=1176127 RepID=A0A6A6B6S0_9PEZI|nr:uncharacterized protein K452DRAFT_78302 [Aplosporella prunicola CBS 121167]KAF2138945.1 hypothetical protein K452DRAFT_78302 [Aplosporella prunicola CBS 121167]
MDGVQAALCSPQYYYICLITSALFVSSRIRICSWLCALQGRHLVMWSSGMGFRDMTCPQTSSVNAWKGPKRSNERSTSTHEAVSSPAHPTRVQPPTRQPNTIQNQPLNPHAVSKRPHATFVPSTARPE